MQVVLMWTEQLIFIIEIIGTIAFAISGAMVAIKKEMDVLGVVFLGIITAVGGGVTRDLILGITPPTTFTKPIFAIVAIVTSILVFLPWVQKFFAKNHKFYESTLFIADSLGLAIFTVNGISVAHSVGFVDNIMLLLFVGVVTGCGGGVLRDVLAGDRPYIFVKHFYACASLIGGAVCCLLWQYAGGMYALSIGSVVIITLRILAAHFRWSLPKTHISQQSDSENQNKIGE